MAKLPPTLKYIFLWSAFAAVLLGGAYQFSRQLQQLLPADMKAQRAREGWVVAKNSLGAGEELVEAELDLVAAQPAQEPLTEEATNLVVTLSAEVHDERGARAQISAVEGPCPANALNGAVGLRELSVQRSADGLSLSFKRTACLPRQPGSSFSVTALAGHWYARTAGFLPDLESAVQQLAFVAPSGDATVVYLAAVGYCESEDGGCSATVSVEKSIPTKWPGTMLHLEEDGDTPLNFNPVAD